MAPTLRSQSVLDCSTQESNTPDPPGSGQEQNPAPSRDSTLEGESATWENVGPTSQPPTRSASQTRATQPRETADDDIDTRSISSGHSGRSNQSDRSVKRDETLANVCSTLKNGLRIGISQSEMQRLL